MPAVDSSMISWIEYRERERELDVTFTSGKTYTYFDVASNVFQNFLVANSKGRFFLDNIGGAYLYAQVRGRRRTG